jgi:hypothetical protein
VSRQREPLHNPGLLAGSLVLATLSCAGNRLEVAVARLATHEARLVAIYPVALRFEAPAYRSFELATDEVQAILGTGRFLVLGPDEFDRFDEQSSSLYGSTNLSGKLGALGLSPTAVVALRTWVEQRAQRSSRERTDSTGHGSHRERSAEITYLVHADLLGPDSDEPVASGTNELAVDPFADHPPSDDAPELRRAVKQLATELLARANLPLGPRPRFRDLPFDADWVPWNEERFAMPGRAALLVQLRGLDPASSEAERLLRLSYFEPDLAPDRQNAMLEQPAGLWVNEASGAWKQAGLQPGDLIASAEGDPVCGAQTLLRWANAKPADPLHLTVRRGLETVHLVVPLAER